ncbi:MAG: sensor histidine kinase KdpD [Actinomycetia bacterium]|nr:sensor histidine kinase KdpD [Actinomycetes bacterium]
MDELRPDPEGLLEEAAQTESTRGKLKIFFGYAAGVGKTYAMLDEAQELAAAGADLLVGYVEPHARPETLHLLEGLALLPPKIVTYKNIELREFDLDAALDRRPALILIDELAHTNAEGLRNKKRYQDVEELLNAGINVYTTVNVQHIESLNNIVGDITKITVSETVPDYIFDQADMVKIVDVEPDELLQRFEDGKIYRPDRAATAMDHFFTKANLKLLREIAMRKVADRISHDNQTERQVTEKMASSKLMVCVTHTPSSARCIRWAARMASAFFIPWVAVYVESKDAEDLTDEQQRCKRTNLALAERLGADIITLCGLDIADAVAEYAKLSGITNVVIGKSRRHFLRADFEDRLSTLLPNVEIHVIPDVGGFGAKNIKRPWRRDIAFSWSDLAKAMGLLVLATGISFGLEALHIGDQNIIMVYILAVLIVSRITRGFIYGATASVLSVLIFNFFFTHPFLTFNAIAPGYPVTFIIMLLVAIITSTMTARVKTQAKLAVRSEQRTEILYEINRKLLVTRGTRNIIDQINSYVMKLFGRSVVFYTDPRKEGNAVILRKPGDDSDVLLQSDEAAVATWCYLNKKPAGAGTDTLGGAAAFYLPVVTQGKVLGVIGLAREKGTELLSQDSKFFLQLIVAQAAMALDRQASSDAQRQANESTEKEKVRSTLLRAISHDLRTPLTGILGASSAILENPDALSEAEKEKLLYNIKDDSSWLIRMVENLLSVTRISEEGAKLVKSPEAVEEIVSESVSRIRARYGQARISVQAPDKVLIVPMDGILIEQVLMNLLENALIHNRQDAAIQVRVSRQGARARFEVEDCGSGLAREDLPALFSDLPETSADADSARGFGIGLSICKSIIDAHGGTIAAENIDAGGARFSFELPL